jgi:hypothetical protein
MKNEKYDKIVEFLKESNVELPIDVKNALEDVFNENENIDDVDVYFKEDADVFQDDLILANDVKANVSAPSEGSINNVFTYYGDLEISLSEFVRLYDNKELIEEVTKIDQLDVPTKLNKERFAIVLVESVKWEKMKVARRPHLYVYCPVNSETGGE